MTLLTTSRPHLSQPRPQGPHRPRRSWRAATAALFALVAPLLVTGSALATAGGDPDATSTLWVDVLSERDRGKALPGSNDIAVLVADSALPIEQATAVDSVRAGWRHVLYFDQLLSDRPALRSAADALAAQTPRLTALGTVEIVLADPEPRWLLPPTRDAALAAQVLARLALQASGQDEIGQLRRELLAEPEVPARLAEEARGREFELRQRQLDRLVVWLSEHPADPADSEDPDPAAALPPGPRALWLAASALALPLDPFYDALAGTDSQRAPRAEPPAQALARYLAVTGWTAYPLALQQEADKAGGSSEFDRWREQAGAVERADTVDLLGLLRQRRQRRAQTADGADDEGTDADRAADSAADSAADRAALEVLASSPSASELEQWALQTGGEPLLRAPALKTLLEHLPARLRLTIAAPSLAGGALGRPGAALPLTVRWSAQARPAAIQGRTLRAPAWIADGTSDELAAARARRLLDLGINTGTLELLAYVELPSAEEERAAARSGAAVAGTAIGQLEVQLDLAPFPAAVRAAMSAVDLRLTVLCETAEGQRERQTVLVPEQDLSAGAIWRHVVPLELPADVERVAVVLDDLRGEQHGGELATLTFRTAPTVQTGLGNATEGGGEEADAAASGTASDTGEPAAESRTTTIRRTTDGGFIDEVEVRLAELYVTVTGDGGQPVRGLTREQFTLRQGGVEQEIDSVVDAIDLPITLGLAIDSSSSMFYKLPVVSNAARSLVRSLQRERDHAFLVAFGPRPELVQGVTGDLDRVEHALRGLEAEGGTPLWSAVVMALEQLAGQKGKKALVVFLDGADDDGNARYRDSLAAAERAGVPIYLIVMNNEAARTEGKDFRTRSFTSRLDRLAAAGGGRVYYLPVDADLEPVYRRIENELRSYYLLTYYVSADADTEAAEVKVEAGRKGISVRTLPSYGPT